MTMRLRILMTADAVGGVWVYATELAYSLCEAGNEVMLAVIGPRPRPDQLRPLRSVPGLQLKITDLLLEWTDPAGTDITRASEMLRSIADEFQPDVVHLNSFREGNLNWSAPVLIVAHSCVQTWSRACRSGPLDGARWSTYCDRVAAALSRADAWVAPSAAFRDLISATYRPPVKGSVIRNGLTIAARATAKQPYILGAGRLWDEAKNLAAVAAIASELPWPVRVAGEMCGPDGSDVKAASVVRRSTRSQCITHGVALALPGRGLAGPASSQGANAGPALFAARHGRRVPGALSGDDGLADASAASLPSPFRPPFPPPLGGRVREGAGAALELAV
jgi:glycosyltransferase involved in cell wall biosynthesis